MRLFRLFFNSKNNLLYYLYNKIPLYISSRLYKIFGKIDRFFVNRNKINYPIKNKKNLNIAVIGVFLQYKKNYFKHLYKRLSETKYHNVDSYWVQLGKCKTRNKAFCCYISPTPKFKIISEMIEYIKQDKKYDYFVITDDDFIVNKNILDVMIDIMVSNNICLAQPSRSLLGEAGHPITRQIPNLKFRFTNFVEIGPLFIIRNDLLTKIPLYLEDSPQGFGYDLIWFEMIKKYKTKFAIIDCCIASHGMRKVGETYNHASYQNMKKKLLKNYPSIKFMENYDSEGRTIKSWPVDKKYL